MKTPKTTPPVLQIRPRHTDELVKASQLVELSGASELSLNDRRTFNILLKNAHGPCLAEPGATFEIDLSELATDHESNDSITKSVKALMRVVVIVAGDPSWDDEGTGYTHLLGDCDMSSPRRQKGKMRYSFPPKLAVLLANSVQYTRLQTKVMRQFKSKYALTLYELVAKRINLSKDHENFSLDEFRAYMGVPDNKLSDWSNLKKFCIDKALAEVNQLAEFGVSISPNKIGRKTVGVRVVWYAKDESAKAEAMKELEKHSLSRKARREGNVETVVSPKTTYSQE